MKKLITAAMAATLLLSACGQSRDLNVNGNTKHYPTYGFFNESTDRSKNVCYELSVGNVVWSIILIETIVAPIYFIGFSLFNPVDVKTGEVCGIDR